MSKYETKRREANFLIITTLLIIILKYAFGGDFSIKYGETIYLLLIGVLLFFLYILTSKKYNNMSTFFLLTFLLVGLLPYCHYLLYSNNKDNYSFDNDYLKNNIVNYKKELLRYKDSVSVFELKTISYQAKVDTTLKNKQQRIKDYIFVVKDSANIETRRPDDRSPNQKKIDVYKNNKKIATLKLNSGLLNDDIAHYLKEMNNIKAKIKNPEKFIPYNDIWLDSVTGFIFSFIKPLSKLSQIIRLLQLVTAYFLFNMISSWLKLSKSLNVTRKNV